MTTTERRDSTMTVDQVKLIARWLETLAARGVVTIGGKGGALELTKEMAQHD